MINKGWIGVDLDGTLAHYTKWVDLLDIGEPIWPMVERVKQWLREGKEVRVFTARACPPFFSTVYHNVGYKEVSNVIGSWCEKHIGQRLAVTCTKDLHMIELWDDRAVQVELNVGEPVTYWLSRV